MPAIALRMARSAALLCIMAVFAAADTHNDVMEVLTKMAAALTQTNADRGGSIGGNVAEFMSCISRNMPEYDALKANVTALVNNAEISSSIEPLTEDQKGDTYQIDLDWFLQIQSLEPDGPMVRRRQVVHCELRKEDKHWKVVALKPLDFFASADLGR